MWGRGVCVWRGASNIFILLFLNYCCCSTAELASNMLGEKLLLLL